MKKHLFIFTVITLMCFTSCSKEEENLPWWQDPEVLSRRPVKPTVNEIPITRPEIMDEVQEINDRIHSFSWKLFQQYYQNSNDNVLIAPYDILSSLRYRVSQKGEEAKMRFLAMMDLSVFSDKIIDNYFYYTEEELFSLEFLTSGPYVRYRKNFVQESDNTISTIDLFGGWSKAFDEKDTKRMMFHKSDGTQEEVDMMFRIHQAYYHEFGEYTVVRIDVLDSNFDTFFVLPNEGYTIDEVIKRISPSDFTEKDAKQVYLGMPKFSIQQRNILDDDMLQQLGYYSVNTRAECSDDIVKINTIWQDCSLSVSEKGFGNLIDSWSSTGYIPYATSYAHFCLDHPFIFGFLERNRNTPLFIGYYGY